MSNPQPEATMLTSFSDLPTVAPDRTYIIAFNYEGAPYKIEVRKLALEEYYQHDHDEPFPKPPTRPSRDGLQPDYDSPKWDISLCATASPGLTCGGLRLRALRIYPAAISRQRLTGFTNASHQACLAGLRSKLSALTARGKLCWSSGWTAFAARKSERIIAKLLLQLGKDYSEWYRMPLWQRANLIAYELHRDKQLGELMKALRGWKYKNKWVSDAIPPYYLIAAQRV